MLSACFCLWFDKANKLVISAFIVSYNEEIQCVTFLGLRRTWKPRELREC